MIKIKDKSKCSGCLTCKEICPKKCISSKEDKAGFIYPIINKDECIECNLCEKVCPLLNYKDNKEIGKELFAAYAKNDVVLNNGSSGGMFETLSRYVLKRNGVVYASKFDDNLILKCFRATNSDEVKQLCKSKYLQSNVSVEFSNIENDLKKGIQVMFCGTPCQVAGLKNYLQVKKLDISNLILIDFFCHGVPSQSLFDKCKEYIEKKKNIKIKSFVFRQKIKNGSTPHYYSYTYEDLKGRKNTKIELYFKNPFYYGFQKYITLRESCYNCNFRNGNHSGDITIGDFHQIENYIKDIDRIKGVSTIIINTDTGFKIWEECKRNLNYYQLPIKKLLEDKVIYFEQIKITKERQSFIKDLEENKDFDYIVEKYLNGKKEWKKNIYYRLPKIFRKALKKICF